MVILHRQIQLWSDIGNNLVKNNSKWRQNCFEEAQNQNRDLSEPKIAIFDVGVESINRDYEKSIVSPGRNPAWKLQFQIRNACNNDIQTFNKH